MGILTLCTFGNLFYLSHRICSMYYRRIILFVPFFLAICGCWYFLIMISPNQESDNSAIVNCTLVQYSLNIPHWRRRICTYKTPVCYVPHKNIFVTPNHLPSSDLSVDIGIDAVVQKVSRPWKSPLVVPDFNLENIKPRDIIYYLTANDASFSIGHIISDYIFNVFAVLFYLESITIHSVDKIYIVQWITGIPQYNNCPQEIITSRPHISVDSSKPVCCQNHVKSCHFSISSFHLTCKRLFHEMIPDLLWPVELIYLHKELNDTICFPKIIVGTGLFTDHCIDKSIHGRFGNIHSHYCNQRRLYLWKSYVKFILFRIEANTHLSLNSINVSAGLWLARADMRMACWYDDLMFNKTAGILNLTYISNFHNMSVVNSMSLLRAYINRVIVFNCGSNALWALFLPSPLTQIFILCSAVALDYHLWQWLGEWKHVTYLLHGQFRPGNYTKLIHKISGYIVSDKSSSYPIYDWVIPA